MASKSTNLQVSIGKSPPPRGASCDIPRLLDLSPEAAGSIIEETIASEADARRITDTPVRALLDDAPAILFVASREGVVRYCNNFLLSYSGLSAATAARTAVIDLIHPRDRRLVAVASARAAEAPVAFSVACRLRGRSGEYKRFHVRVVPVARDDTTWWCGVGTEAEEQRFTTETTSQSHE